MGGHIALLAVSDNPSRIELYHPLLLSLLLLLLLLFFPVQRSSPLRSSAWAWQVDTGGRPHEVKDHSRPHLDRQAKETDALLGGFLNLYQIHSATLESGVLQVSGRAHWRVVAGHIGEWCAPGEWQGTGAVMMEEQRLQGG